MHRHIIFRIAALIIAAALTVLFLRQLGGTGGTDTPQPPEKDSRFGIDENIVDSWDDIYMDAFNIE